MQPGTFFTPSIVVRPRMVEPGSNHEGGDVRGYLDRTLVRENEMNNYRRRIIPPSQLRYEKTHPVISCRLTLEIHQRLQKARELEGKTYTDILLRGLEKTEHLNAELEPIIQKAWDEGFKAAKQYYSNSDASYVSRKITNH
jgi:hypothetical protein